MAFLRYLKAIPSRIKGYLAYRKRMKKMKKNPFIY